MVYVLSKYGKSLINDYICEGAKISTHDAGIVIVIATVVLIVMLICFTNIVLSIISQIRSEKRRGEFVSGIIHDVKTPITTINMSCQVLRELNEEHKAEEVNYITVINEEAERLNEVTELIMSIINAKDVVVFNDIVDLHEVISEAIKSMNVVVLHNKGTVIEELIAQNHYVKGDKSCLKSVFLNLIDNAVKYCESYPLIIISTTDEDDKVLIKIQDNGIGMKKDDIKKVFKKSFRVSSEKTNRVNGFGLGLYHTKQIIDKLSGNISIDSNLGRGTTFVITLPYHKPP